MIIDTDDMPDVCDEVIAEATAEVIADLNEILLEGIKLREAARESVVNNIPLAWEDLLDTGDLVEAVMDEVMDSISWAIKNNHL